MKLVVLVSLAGMMLLTGCNNFELLKNESKNPLSNLKANPTGDGTQQQEADDKNALPFQPIDDSKPAPTVEQRPIEPTKPLPPAPPPSITPPTAKSPEPQQPLPPPNQAPAQPPVVVKPPEKAAPTQTQTQAPPSAPKSEVAEKKIDHNMTLDENDQLMALVNHLYLRYSRVTVDQPSKFLFKPQVPSQYIEKLKDEVSGTYEKFNFKLSASEKTLVEFKDLKMNLYGRNIFEKDGYTLTTICLGAKCEMVFTALLKVDAKDKTVEYYPRSYKLMKGLYAPAFRKDEKIYDEERKAEGYKPAPSVPQLAAYEKLEQELSKSKKAYMDQARSILETPATVYSDSVFFNQDVEGQKYNPVFQATEEGLVVSAEIHSVSAEKLEFKVLLKKGENQARVVKGNRSLGVIQNKEGQIYTLMMTVKPYESKIKDTTTAVATQLCYVDKVQESTFLACKVLKASDVLGQEGVVEGNLKETVK